MIKLQIDPITLIGLSKIELARRLKTKRLPYRVSREDSKVYTLSIDYLPQRYNIELDSGMVTMVKMG